jgi:hypothetical protein
VNYPPRLRTHVNNGKDAAEVTNGPERVRMPAQELTDL